MEKSEDGKRNQGNKTYSLFSSIINLSSAATGTRKKAEIHSQPPNKSVSQQSSRDINGAGQMTNATPRNRSQNSSPIRPNGPKTLSILTALNEIASQGQGTVQHSINPPSPAKSSVGDKNADNNIGSHQNNKILSQSPRGPNIVNHRVKTTKERAPKWILNIFELTRNGRLNELQKALDGLEPTLVRHMTDSKGNNLLHCSAASGQLPCLAWLTSIMEPSLNDQNSAGQNVTLTALEHGQLTILKWLIENTRFGERTLVTEGSDGGLLHFGAKHSSAEVIRWLVKEVASRGSGVDIPSNAGTPLMIAAKRGQIDICHEFILAGADPFYQTELHWRASDFAIRHGQYNCARYLIMTEVAAGIAVEYHNLIEKMNSLKTESESMKLHFRETLRVGKWLAKERGELIKNVSTLGSGFNQDATSPSLLVVGSCTRFADLEHKLVKGENFLKGLMDQDSSSARSRSFSRQDHLDLSLHSRDDDESSSSQIFLKRLSSAHRDKSFSNQIISDSHSSKGDISEDNSWLLRSNQAHLSGKSEFSLSAPKSASNGAPPWLLSSSDSSGQTSINSIDYSHLISRNLSALNTTATNTSSEIQISNTIDLARIPLSDNFGKLLSVSSKNTNSTAVITKPERGKDGKEGVAAILEIIEPTLTQIKGGEMGKEDTESFPCWLTKSEIKFPGEDNIYSQILGRSSQTSVRGVGVNADSPSSSSIHSKGSEGIYFAPDLIRGTEARGRNNQEGCSSSLSYSSGTPEGIYQDISVDGEAHVQIPSLSITHIEQQLPATTSTTLANVSIRQNNSKGELYEFELSESPLQSLGNWSHPSPRESGGKLTSVKLRPPDLPPFALKKQTETYLHRSTLNSDPNSLILRTTSSSSSSAAASSSYSTKLLSSSSSNELTVLPVANPFPGSLDANNSPTHYPNSSSSNSGKCQTAKLKGEVKVSGPLNEDIPSTPDPAPYTDITNSSTSTKYQTEGNTMESDHIMIPDEDLKLKGDIGELELRPTSPVDTPPQIDSATSFGLSLENVNQGQGEYSSESNVNGETRNIGEMTVESCEHRVSIDLSPVIKNKGDGESTTTRNGVAHRRKSRSSFEVSPIKARLSAIHHRANHQRASKPLRTPRPWYEIEGSDDEKTLLRVTKAVGTGPLHGSGDEEGKEGDDSVGSDNDDSEESPYNPGPTKQNNCPDFLV